jgi:biopolymer transport protein ExbD
MAHAEANGDDAGAITGINITPLVDISLVLLIVFMLTAKVMVTQAIPMQVPTSSTPTAVQVTLAVTVAEDGAMTLDGAKMADGPALARAAKAQAGNDAAEVHAVIAALRAAPHGAVIGALDALRSVGITKIAFAVERKK